MNLTEWEAQFNKPQTDVSPVPSSSFTGSSLSEWEKHFESQRKKPAETRNESVLLGGEPLEVSGTLKMDDLEKNPEYTNAIREYMVRRKGVQYEEMDAEQLVDDFTKHMRYFNVNEGITISEAMFVTKGDDETKRIAANAYEVYDSLGNVFTNDGLLGAADGVKDYMAAILTSPSTYLGLGAGKVVSFISGKAAGQGIKELAKTAGREAAKKATKGKVRDSYRKAYNDVIAKGARTNANRSLATTGTVDGGMSILQNYSQQGVEKDVGSSWREEYNPFEMAFSFVGGIFGAGAQLAGRSISQNASKITSGKDLKGARKQLKKHSAATTLTAEQKKAINKSLSKRVKAIQQLLNDKKIGVRTRLADGKKVSWKNKVLQGIVDAKGRAVPSEVIKAIFLGVGEDVEAIEGLTGGIAQIMSEAKVKIRKNKRITDVATDIIRVLDQDTLQDISGIIQNETGLALGEIADLGNKIGNIFAASVSEGGKILNSASQMAKQYNRALVEGSKKNMVYSDEMLSDAYEIAQNQAPVTKIGKFLDKFPGQGYGMNVWKRLLVSAPQTTAANILGFGQYYIANSVAEMFQSVPLVLGSALVKDEKKAQIMREQAKALWAIQGVKLRNFADPYTTHDAYLAILETDDKLARRLRETFAGGVRRTEERFNIDGTNKLFKGIESYTQMAQTLSGVNIQDSWTKSQMFMTSIDKHLRLQKGKTLNEVLESGSLDLIDDTVQGKALDDTLKSVFSKDYKNDKMNFFRKTAAIVEDASNSQLGYILPFGRFMNNIVATAYQWNPVTGLIPMAGHIARGRNLEATEAFSRAMVGGSAIAMTMKYDLKQQERGEAWNEMQTPSGNTIDVTNTFPFSLLKVSARYFNRKLNGEPVSKELTQDLAQQLAIGQAIKDVNFGSDVTRLVDAASRAILEGDASGWRLIFDALGNTGGNIASGYTRPFDPVNKLAGLATESLTGIAIDDAIDRRQTKGFVEKLTQGATRYIDNVFEALALGITGEKKLIGTPLTPAGREGDIYDPSPVGSSFGVKTKQARTYADHVFGSVDLPSWKAGMYTGIPEFDAFINKHIAPLIEHEAELLWKNKKFREGTGLSMNVQLYRQQKVKQMLADAKAKVKKYAASVPTAAVDQLRVKLDRKPDAIVKEAKRALGIDSSIRNMTTEELRQMFSMIDYMDSEAEN